MPRPKMSRRAPRSDGLRTISATAGLTSRQSASGFPERSRVILKYQSYLRVNPGVLTGTDTVFSLNGVFDPEVSGGGHQPRDFDTWAAIYAKYRVHRTWVVATVRQRASHGIACYLIPNNTATAFTSAQIPAELPRAVSMGVTGSNQPVATTRQMFDAHSILGVTRVQYLANEDTAGPITANPNEQVYVHLWAQQLDSTTVLDCEYDITLSYDVEFYDRAVVGPSSLLRELCDLRRRVGAASAEEDGEDQPVIVRPAPSATAVGVGGSGVIRRRP